MQIVSLGDCFRLFSCIFQLNAEEFGASDEDDETNVGDDRGGASNSHRPYVPMGSSRPTSDPAPRSPIRAADAGILIYIKII